MNSPHRIHLVNVCHYFNGLPHQLKALDELQSEIEKKCPEALEKFEKAWRTPGLYNSAPLTVLEAPIEQETEPQKNAGKLIRIPGISKPVALNQSIVWGGNFTWAEATHDGERIPVNKQVTSAIVQMAKRLEEIRTLFGNRRIMINSWYRDPISNAKVGGVPNSRHIVGDAVDFVVEGVSPTEVYQRLDTTWEGGLGDGSIDGFTHADLGEWARWDY